MDRLQNLKSKTFFPKIKVKKPQDEDNLIDVGLSDLKFIKDINSLAVTTMFYPVSRDITSDDFTLLPYQEYTDEISEGGRTTYEVIHDFSGKLFGIFLASIIFIIFQLNQDQVFSIEAAVGIIGAYIAGKELWSDLNIWLQKISKNWKFSWKDKEFYYQKVDFGSIQNYTRYIRNTRYGSNFILPTKLDFINQSSSKILELKYSQKELDLMSKDYTHLVSLEYPAKFGKEFTKNEYLLAIKLSLIKNVFGIEIISEYFQSKYENSTGCLDFNGNWLENKTMLRKAVKIGNLKIYLENTPLELQIIS